MVDEENGESVLPLAGDDETMVAKEGMLALGVAGWRPVPLTDIVPPLPASHLTPPVLGDSPFARPGELEYDEECMKGDTECVQENSAVLEQEE